jgi:carboxyl-terminal processing protease
MEPTSFERLPHPTDARPAEPPRPRAPGGELVAWAIAIVLAALLVALESDPAAPRKRPRATVDDVRSIVARRYFRDVDPRELEWSALRGMMGGLDPYSSFLSPEEAVAFREDTEGHFAGLGIEITVEKGYVTVIAPLEETPAFAAGILPGDRVIAIDGQPREFASTEEAARVLRGKPGTKIELTVLHEGATRAEEITLTRREIDVKSVKRPRLLEDDARIGYVRITHFKPNTHQDLRAAIEGLRAKGMQALILDLRSNPGGLLDEAVEVVDLFVEEGLIVRTVGRDPAAISERYAKKEGTLPPFPLAVLVNGGSASASEVVAGALKDLGRATIVGTRTHGKGSVQSVLTLEDGSILKLTTAHYFTRSGRPIHREANAKESDPWGVLPDVAADLEPRKLVEIYRRRDGLDYYDETAADKQERKPLRDPQLDAAAAALDGALRGEAPRGVAGSAQAATGTADVRPGN